MDPEQTLRLVAAAITGGDLTEASYLLDEYNCWRRKGGFEPKIGDVFGDVFATLQSQRLTELRHTNRTET